jgi:hypothetical protein
MSEIEDTTGPPMSIKGFPLRELIASGKWTSALFTTYSLSLSFVEDVVYPAMRRTANSCAILADLVGYSASLSEAGAYGAGREYQVWPVQMRKGIFHPKIMLLLNDEGVTRAAVSSGNLTLSGWGWNAEIVEPLLPGRDSACFDGLLDFLESLRSTNERFDCEFPHFGIHRDACRRAALVPGEGRSRFLHTVREPLAPQLFRLAKEMGGAVSLTVLSPFFGGTAGVCRLAEELLCEDVSVAVTSNAPSQFDFGDCQKHGVVARPVQCEAWNDQRPLHAKLLDIKCANGRMIVAGSANATAAALVGDNVEAVVVRMHGDADVYGWTPSGICAGKPSGDGEHAPSAEICAMANYDGSRLVAGRIFGKPSAEGAWQGWLTQAAARKPIGIIAVDAVGRFSFTTEEDLLTWGGSTQVVLEREDREIRGWVTMPDFGGGPHARMAKAILRMISGSDDATDVQAVVEFLTVRPADFFEAALRRSGRGRVGETSPPPDVVVPTSRLKPTAPPMHDRDRKGASQHQFGLLLEALVGHFETVVVGESEPDDSDDSVPGDEPARPEQYQHRDESMKKSSPTGDRRSRKVPPPAKIRAEKFEAVFMSLLKEAEHLPPEHPKTPVFRTLFNMATFIAPRCHDGDSLEKRLLSRWWETARRCRKHEIGHDDLDLCAAALCAKQAINSPDQASAAKGALQRWLHREIDEEAIERLEPQVANPEVVRLLPAASQSDWSDAWRRLAGAETSWTEVSRMMAAVDCGEPPWIPSGIDPDAARTLKDVAAGLARRGSVVSIVHGWTGQPACPHCHIVLARDPANELRARRIARCRTCGRVVVDMSL